MRINFYPKRLSLILKTVSILLNHFSFLKAHFFSNGTLYKLFNAIAASKLLTKPKYSFFKSGILNSTQPGGFMPSVCNITSSDKTLFYSFMKLNSWIKNKNLKTHHSFSLYYLYDNKSNLGFFNIKRIFNL